LEGTLILVLMMVRLLLRLSNELPAYPKENAPLQKLLSQIVHWSFYGLLFLFPLTGAVAWFRLSEAAGDLHEALRGGLLLLIALHVGAALFHEYLQKTRILQRMWWG
jgi:cytochrome b561